MQQQPQQQLTPQQQQQRGIMMLKNQVVDIKAKWEMLLNNMEKFQSSPQPWLITNPPGWDDTRKMLHIVQRSCESLEANIKALGLEKIRFEDIEAAMQQFAPDTTADMNRAAEAAQRQIQSTDHPM